MRIKRNKTTSKAWLKRGFSLPELIIVIAIFVLISSVALFNQNKLSSNVLLTNMAYEVGLAIREAQVYGIGVRGDDGQTTFSGMHGAHFSVENDTMARQVTVYSDKNDDAVFESGEEKSLYTFDNGRGNHIVALCAGDLPAGTPCVAGGTNSVSQLDVVFERPNPAAILYAADSGGVMTPRTGRAYIVLNSVSNDDCRAVVVESTGQIRVDDSRNNICSNQ